MNREPSDSPREPSAPGFQDVLERAIEGLENDGAFDLEPFLAGHAEHADAVRARVAKLRRTGMLRRAESQAAAVELPDATFLPARAIAGRYRVLREIGRGGMGRVLLARDERLARDVAIKLAHLPADDSARARLEREARILAQLEHPGIVAIYDGGTTDDGRAFCAMRVAGGRTLHEVIAKAEVETRSPAELGLARKVQIAIAVCDAVGFAHRRGVVHRDLKPANVMLGESGEVQVVDWGLAKRVGAPDPDAPADRNLFASFSSGAYETVDGYAFGTPSYCAPEQARGEIAQIDERSDVFGLGAILHHLLVGRPPYYGKDRDEVLERARKGRFNDPALSHVASRVPAELAAVCRKACASNRSERYASARELADDLRAFLETRTVRAHATGTWAETKKWVARNRALASALAASFAILVAGFVTSVAYARRAAAAAAQAREHAQTSKAVADFMVDVFDGANPLIARRKDVSARELLDDARQRAVPSLESQPSVAARVAYHVARAYRGLGLAAETEELASKCLELLRRAEAGDDDDLGRRALLLRASALSTLGRYEEADACARQAVASGGELDGSASWQDQRAWIELASIARVRGRLDDSADLFAQIEPVLARTFGFDSDLGAFFLNERAVLRRTRGDAAGAIEDQRRAIRAMETASIPAPPLVRAVALNNLATALSDEHHPEEARECIEQALELQRQGLDPHHGDLLGSLATAAVIALQEHRFEEAERLAREAFDGFTDTVGPATRETLRARDTLGSALTELGRLDEAEPLLEGARQGFEDLFGPDDPSYLGCLVHEARLLAQKQRFEDALASCRAALAGFERSHAPAMIRLDALSLQLDLQRRQHDDAGAAVTEAALQSLTSSTPQPLDRPAATDLR